MSKKANYKCELTNDTSRDVQVHHIIPLNILIDKHHITKDNIDNFLDILYDISNGIVINTKIHREFHYLYGHNTDNAMLLEYKEILYLESV